MPGILLENTSFTDTEFLKYAFGSTMWEQIILVDSFILRMCLTFLFFFLLAVAERTFKQR